MNPSSVQHIAKMVTLGSILVLQSCMTHQLDESLWHSNVTVLQTGNSCTPGYFGEGCARQCPLSCSKTCDKQGLCTSCSRVGVQLPHCTKRCAMGFYGLSCKKKCLTCQYENCEPQFGKCQKCRRPGFRLPFCKAACLPGTFGMHCVSRCPLPCGEMCDTVTGGCTKCKYGHGPRCQVNCASETNHEVCTLYCPDRCLTWCNTADRTCTVCSPGYKPPYCKQHCDDGYYGYNCGAACSVRCTNSSCHPVSGMCYSCKDGYVGHRCNGQCIPGLYGPDCLLPCSESCAGSLCNFTTGTCTRCSSGYTGERCYELCQDGKYGEDCKLYCPVTCGSKCDPVTGECWHCVPGYVGAFCNETCQKGTHGQGCTSICSIGCFNNICDHVTGICESCHENLRGDLCDKANVRSPTTSVAFVILLSLGLTVVAMILIIACVCFQRKVNQNCIVRNRETHKDGQSKSEYVNTPEICCNIYGKDVCVPDTESRSTDQKLRLLARASRDYQRGKMSENYVKFQATHFKQSRYDNTEVLIPCSNQVCTSCDDIKESTERSSYAVEKTVNSMLTFAPQETEKSVPSSRIFYSNRLNKRNMEDNIIAETGLSSLVSKQDESTRKVNSFRSAVKHVLTTEDRAGSIPADDRILADTTKGFRTPVDKSGETEMTLFEHTAYSHGNTRVSSTCALNLSSSLAVLRTSERSPEMINLTSHDSIETDCVDSKNLLLGVNSVDLSRETSSLCQRDDKLPETEHTTNHLSKQRFSFRDKQNDNVTNIFIGAHVQRSESTHSVPETLYLNPSSCEANQIEMVDQKKVSSSHTLALAKMDYQTNKSPVDRVDELTNDVQDCIEQSQVLLEMTKSSCNNERLVMISGGHTSCNSMVHSDCMKIVSPPKLGKRDVPPDCPVQEENILQSVINPPLEIISCPHTSSERIFKNLQSDLGQEETTSLTQTNTVVMFAHENSHLNVQIYLPKLQMKTEETHNDLHAHIDDGNQQTTLIAGTVSDKGVRKYVPTQDDIVTPLASGSASTVSKRTTRVAGVGENSSPKLIRCSTTRQVSPMYSHNNITQTTTRLQPLPTPPPEGIKSLRPIRKTSSSPSNLEFPVPPHADDEK